MPLDHSFVQHLPADFWRRQDPSPLKNPRLAVFNQALADDLGMDSAWWTGPEGLAVLAGQRNLTDAGPVAMKYGGHQFGGWNPELGDGRGLLLAEWIDAQARRWDLHLKGSGPTPFSRMGDGRAVLRSSLRELLAGEALHALGVPTTRALALVASDTPVQRERRETAATLLRVADSHIRFGHVEWLAHTQRSHLLPVLLDYVIERHYPDCQQADRPYAALFRQIIQRTARLMAAWQAWGFAHGVMNTDNFSITGATLDFGPYAFMDRYQPQLICNHSDHSGRYAWHLQPSVGLWNLNALAHGLAPVVSIEDLRDALGCYESELVSHYDQLMNRRLGLGQPAPGDRELVRDWLQLLNAEGMDYGGSFRWLSEQPMIDLLDGAGPAKRAWLLRYQARLADVVEDQRMADMQQVNPRYLLRNYLAELAIRAAEQGDFEPALRLLSAVQNPFTRRPQDDAELAAEPPDWGRCLDISCSS